MLTSAFLILLASVLMYAYLHDPEQFMNVLFIEDTHNMSIVMPYDAHDRSLVSLAKSNKKFKISPMSADPPQSNKNHVVYYSNVTVLPRDAVVLTATNDVNTACFIKGFYSRLGGDYLSDLVGKKIGYVNDADLAVAIALLYANETDYRAIQFVKLDPITMASELERNQMTDALFFFANAWNPLYKSVQEKKLIVLSLNRSFDYDIARTIMPHAVFKDVDTRFYFNNIADQTTPVKTVVEFYNVLYTKDSKPLSYLHALIIQMFAQNYEKNNHIARYFKTHAQTLTNPSESPRLRHSTEMFMDANSSTMMFAPTINVPGYYDSATLTFEYPNDVLDGVPLNRGDFVVLKNQDKQHENAEYVVQYVANGKAVLRRKFLDLSDNPDKYFCVTNKALKRQEECTSPRNRITHELKPQLDVWDAPCTMSEQCPFFQANKLYKNYRGGCVDGTCEMPLGVKRIGFRKYTGDPLCHGCPLSNPKCCDTQQEPDYAFANDSFERERAGVL